MLFATECDDDIYHVRLSCMGVSLATVREYDFFAGASFIAMRLCQDLSNACNHRCLMYYYGDESEIDLESHGEREFSDWCWMPLEQLPEEVSSSPNQPCSPVGVACGLVEEYTLQRARQHDEGQSRTYSCHDQRTTRNDQCAWHGISSVMKQVG